MSTDSYLTYRLSNFKIINLQIFLFPKMGLVYVIGIWILRIFSPDIMIGFWKCSGRRDTCFPFPEIQNTYKQER